MAAPRREHLISLSDQLEGAYTSISKHRAALVALEVRTAALEAAYADAKLAYFRRVLDALSARGLGPEGWLAPGAEFARADTWDLTPSDATLIRVCRDVTKWPCRTGGGRVFLTFEFVDPGEAPPSAPLRREFAEVTPWAGCFTAGEAAAPVDY